MILPSSPVDKPAFFLQIEKNKAKKRFPSERPIISQGHLNQITIV